jgi:iron complex transport system ATP-binding protein
VVFTTHHPDQALAAADRAVLLHGGRVMADGPAEAALTTESLTTLYGRPVEVVAVKGADGRPRRACIPGVPRL